RTFRSWRVSYFSSALVGAGAAGAPGTATSIARTSKLFIGPFSPLQVTTAERGKEFAAKAFSTQRPQRESDPPCGLCAVGLRTRLAPAGLRARGRPGPDLPADVLREPGQGVVDRLGRLRFQRARHDPSAVPQDEPDGAGPFVPLTRMLAVLEGDGCLLDGRAAPDEGVREAPLDVRPEVGKEVQVRPLKYELHVDVPFKRKENASKGSPPGGTTGAVGARRAGESNGRGRTTESRG